MWIITGMSPYTLRQETLQRATKCEVLKLWNGLLRAGYTNMRADNTRTGPTRRK